MNFFVHNAPKVPFHRVINVSAVLLSFLGLFLVAFTATPALADANNSFGNATFERIWERTDLPIAQGRLSRSWYWGPRPQSFAIVEPYAESPDGKRTVQYFEKARMEINNPATNTVTNGLLVVELINGRRQEGDQIFVDGGPAQIGIAGDPGNTFPTYTSLRNLYNQPLKLAVGTTVSSTWTSNGKGTTSNYAGDAGTKIAQVENKMGIPAVFWNFLNRKGFVYNGDNYFEDNISNFLFSTGYPITEAYWSKVMVGGQEKDVMFQAFERRIITYTPSNPADYQVEMANVGSHYLRWRYPQGLELPPAPAIRPIPIEISDPIAKIFLGNQPAWYEVQNDVLNVRTGPGRQFDNPVYTETYPIVWQYVRGNRVQPIRSIAGEEIEPGNNTWFQVYENPNLYVYSGYLAKMNIPAYPAVPRTHKGIWVSVSLTKQMVAVYDGNRLLYRTLVTTGKSNPGEGPERDYRTVTGVFRIDGSYRPRSQTMTGGDKARDDEYYNLKDVRNVSYFYQAFALHGAYWHARFGTVPLSHGCVNMTNYDSGLMYQLPAGTIVDVFRDERYPDFA